MPRPRRPPHDEEVGVAVGWVASCDVVELLAGHPTPRPRPKRPEQSDDVAGGDWSLVVVDEGVDVGSPPPPPPPPPSRPPPEPPPSKPPPLPPLGV